MITKEIISGLFIFCSLGYGTYLTGVRLHLRRGVPLYVFYACLIIPALIGMVSAYRGALEDAETDVLKTTLEGGLSGLFVSMPLCCLIGILTHAVSAKISGRKKICFAPVDEDVAETFQDPNTQK